MSKTYIQVEITKDAVLDYLSSLHEDEFCRIFVEAELLHASYSYLIPLIRHFKHVEQSMGEVEIEECGDLSPKEIEGVL